MTDTTKLETLREDAVFVDIGNREVVVSAGADRIRFLQGLLTANVSGVPTGRGTRAALLTAKGQMVSDIRLFVREDAVWLVVEAGQGAPTAEVLSRYAIMDDFTAKPAPEVKLLAVLGPRAARRLAAAGIEAELLGALTAAPAWTHAPAGALWLVRARELGQDGFWAGGAADEVTALADRIDRTGVPRLAASVAEAARIAAREPRWGAEITPDYFPMEVGLGDTIDYRKGCFLGQEPLVRIRDRGRITWRLVGLHFGGRTLPLPGDVIESDLGPKAGRVASAAWLPGGAGVAMAHLHASVPAGTEVQVRRGEVLVPATVVE